MTVTSGRGPRAIRRVDFGSFTRPAAETGTGAPRVERLLGYVVEHPDGWLLFDTGMAIADPGTEAHYRPQRIPVDAALGAAGATRADIAIVANCHLHLDHCGGNPSFAGTPIACQRSEVDGARREPDYTLPELVDHPGVRWELLDGAADLLPGVQVLPTPGHTPGHQSLVVRLTDGTVVLAGQSHPDAAAFAAEVDAVAAGGVEGDRADDGAVAAWLPLLLALDPARVLFAHDGSTWEPGRA